MNAENVIKPSARANIVPCRDERDAAEPAAGVPGILLHLGPTWGVKHVGRGGWGTDRADMLHCTRPAFRILPSSASGRPRAGAGSPLGAGAVCGHPGGHSS